MSLHILRGGSVCFELFLQPVDVYGANELILVIREPTDCCPEPYTACEFTAHDGQVDVWDGHGDVLKDIVHLLDVTVDVVKIVDATDLTHCDAGGGIHAVPVCFLVLPMRSSRIVVSMELDTARIVLPDDICGEES